jgi:putative ABC transport system permease protein
VSATGAEREMQTIAARLAQAYAADDAGWGVRAQPLLEQLVGPVRPALLILLSAALCVLLIGAANLASLFLVRFLGRERELAIRTALGATRGRLAQELAAEAAVLGVVAGVLGMGLATAGVRILRSFAPVTLPRVGSIGVDAGVLAFCAVSSGAAVLIFGVLPAWRVTPTAEQAGRATRSAGHRRLQNALVVAQVAVGLVLLTGAGLLVESFAHFARGDSGFRTEGVLTVQLDLSAERYGTPERQWHFIASVLERLAAVPGIRGVSASDAIPGAGAAISLFTVVGDPAPDVSSMPIAPVTEVSQDYFHTLGIQLVRGRVVLPTDDDRSLKVAVIDQVIARRYFGARDPIGRRLAYGPDTLQIVGIVAPVSHGGLTGEEGPMVYAALAQYPSKFVELEIRGVGNPGALASAVKRAIATVDATVPVSHAESLSAWLLESVGTMRFSSLLTSLFALIALVLGVLGIYGVLAYVVMQRQREIGIRLALGATQTRVAASIVHRGLVLAASGVVVGSGTTWILIRVIVHAFGGAPGYDPGLTVQGWSVVPTVIGAAMTFLAVAVIAASVPAFRTTRVSPAEALTSM